MMLYKIFQIATALFALFLAACSSTPKLSSEQLAKQQAAKARIELGLAYLNQQNPSLAKQNFDKALEHAPQYYLVYSALAYFYQQQGNIQQTKQHYQKALDIDNQQGDVHNNYGAFLCTQGEYSAAYQQFEQALASPNYYHQADSYENIALCSISAKNTALFEHAISQLEKLDSARSNQLKHLLK